MRISVLAARYRHYLRTAASPQWHKAAVDLAPEATAWPALPKEPRRRLERLVAGFCVGEARVASELAPFAAASAGDNAARFRAQAVDQARHARFFGRVADQVLACRPRRCARGSSPRFLELFERRLPAAARRLATEADLPGAVALYHLTLEGVVFTRAPARRARDPTHTPSCQACAPGGAGPRRRALARRLRHAAACR